MDEFRLPVVTTLIDKRFGVLGEWLTTEISHDLLVPLGALAMIDNPESGEKPQPWESDNYHVKVSSIGCSIRNKHFKQRPSQYYSLAEVRTALEECWHFLVAAGERGLIRESRPDLPEREADLLLRERSHPARGRPLPA